MVPCGHGMAPWEHPHLPGRSSSDALSFSSATSWKNPAFQRFVMSPTSRQMTERALPCVRSEEPCLPHPRGVLALDRAQSAPVSMWDNSEGSSSPRTPPACFPLPPHPNLLIGSSPSAPSPAEPSSQELRPRPHRTTSPQICTSGKQSAGCAAPQRCSQVPKGKDVPLRTEPGGGEPLGAGGLPRFLPTGCFPSRVTAHI